MSDVNLRGLPAVTDEVISAIFSTTFQLRSLDVSHCRQVTGDAVTTVANPVRSLRKLGISRIGKLTDSNIAALSSIFPNLQQLDVSGSALLTDSAFAGFTLWTEDCTAPCVAIVPALVGRRGNDQVHFERRLTALTHLNVSDCPLLTDATFFHLAYATPDLLCLEVSGMGRSLRDEGLVAFFRSTPYIQKVDLEGAFEITDKVLNALTPPSDANALETWPGQHLEHLVISYAVHISDGALLALITRCAKLRVLVADNTRVSDAVVRSFVATVRSRLVFGAEIVCVDCRGLSRGLVEDLASAIRPRRGVKGWLWASQRYFDTHRVRLFFFKP